MKNKNTINFLGIGLLSIILILACSCAKKYAPAQYLSSQDRFGAINIQSSKNIYICPTIDSLPKACRKLLDKKFTPYEYVTDAFKKELSASGITTERFNFDTGPSFDSLQKIINEKVNKSEDAVYLGTELLWLDKKQLNLDAKVFSPSGEIVFEKRGICIIFNSLNDPKGKEGHEIAFMTLRQILNDPNFSQVLQK